MCLQMTFPSAFRVTLEASSLTSSSFDMEFGRKTIERGRVYAVREDFSRPSEGSARGAFPFRLVLKNAFSYHRS